MTRETYIVANSMVTIDPNHKSKTVTLAAFPGSPAHQLDRRETAPTLPTVRAPYVRRKAVGVAHEALMDKAVDRLARHIAGLGVLGQVIL